MNAKEYIEKFYKIRTKDGRLTNLKFNSAQQKFYDLIKSNYGKRPGRYIVLKARQLGISTFTEALLTFFTQTQFNTDSIVIAHDSESSRKIYSMAKLYIQELPDILTPKQKYNNAKMLTFDSDDGNGLKSSLTVGVANDSTRGSTYQYAHLSELAFWKDAETAMLSVSQAVPSTDKSLIIIESTANGFNYFYDLWSKAENGENDYIPVFFPWYLEEGYVKPYDGFKLTDYEKQIKAKYNLANEQLAWRRWSIANNCGGDETLFRQEYPISPEEAFITSGDSVFNNELVFERLKDAPDPIKKGYFVYKEDFKEIKWIDDPKGPISIYEDPMDDYTVLGGDTAGEGEDFYTAQVLNREGKQVAVYHKKEDEDLYAKQMYCLGMYYHSLIAIEVNFSSYTNMMLQKWGYPMLYLREQYDQIKHKYEKKIGFRTSVLTRPIIISNLVEVMREHIDQINDKDTLKEALSFIRKDGKPQAEEGAHDDLIMALAIAYEILKYIPSKQAKEEVYDEDYDFFMYG